jgi:putative ABC transport system permease protein
VTTKMVVENIKHKPMRTLLSILLMGVPVTLILSLVGISEGLSADAQNRARGIGADIVVRTNAASAVSSYSAASIPEKVVSVFQEQPHVKLAMGIIVHNIDFPALNMMGVDMDRFNAMSGGFTYLEGGPLQQPYDVLIDRLYSEQKNAHAGSAVNLLNHEWRVAGVIEGGKMARIVVNKATLQELDSATGKVTNIFLKLDDAANTNAVVQQLQDFTKGSFKIDSMETYTSQFSVTNYGTVKVFTYVVIGIGVVIGFAVVCLSMYMAVLQRTREIGILKSLGGSKAFILRIILAEAALLGIGGTLLGILMSYGARWAILTFVPASFPMIIVHSWWPKALLITLLGAELGALYPGFSAASHDPIEALAYE